MNSFVFKIWNYLRNEYSLEAYNSERIIDIDFILFLKQSGF